MRELQCKVCNKSFSRTDHFRRHQLRHTGEKPHQCEFCEKGFTRSEKLREHYTDCDKRGDRAIPRSAPKGRRRHACEQCIAAKKRCDGGDPCGWCREKSVVCRPPPGSVNEGSVTEEAENDIVDRGSINFLLNGGAEGWLTPFNFPRPIDQVQASRMQNMLTGSSPADSLPLQSSPDFYQLVTQPIELCSFDDALIELFNNPFGFIPQDTPYDPALFPYGSATVPPEDLKMLEIAADLVQQIYAHCWKIGLDPVNEQEILSSLQFLITPERIRKFTSLYFQCWHKNARYVYAPTFNPETAPSSLLVSIIMMGAMFSVDEMETLAVRRVLDITEVYIFSNHHFTAYEDIRHAANGTQSPDDEATNWDKFQAIQAGVLMFAIQHWGGNATARKRAMDTRYAAIINVCPWSNGFTYI